MCQCHGMNNHLDIAPLGVGASLNWQFRTNGCNDYHKCQWQSYIAVITPNNFCIVMIMIITHHDDPTTGGSNDSSAEETLRN